MINGYESVQVGDPIAVNGHGTGHVTGFSGYIAGGVQRLYMVVRFNEYLSCMVPV